MKLVVQIPCLNEETTLPLVLNSIPKKIAGIDKIEILIIDDGSTDNTVEVAKKHGVSHFVHHTRKQGLGRSFHDGAMKSLEMGADIVVNTDGDNQYPQDRIGDLVAPIIKGNADIVIADRQTHLIEHFSKSKKILQKVGSGVVSLAAGTAVPDAVSGFRAYSRESIYRINAVTRYSYTVETIIQAGYKGLHIQSIEVDTNPKLRESRLFNSTFEHVLKSAITITRAYIMYRPYILFGYLGLILLVSGLIPFIRWFLYSIDNSARGHIQSLIIGSILLMAAFFCLALNVIADLIRINRVISEDSLEQTKRMRFNKSEL